MIPPYIESRAQADYAEHLHQFLDALPADEDIIPALERLRDGKDLSGLPERLARRIAALCERIQDPLGIGSYEGKEAALEAFKRLGREIVDKKIQEVSAWTQEYRVKESERQHRKEEGQAMMLEDMKAHSMHSARAVSAECVPIRLQEAAEDSVQFEEERPENWDNRTFVLEKVREDGLNLRKASEARCKESDVVLTAMRQNKLAGVYAHPDLMRNPQFMREAIPLDPGILVQADESIKDNEALFKLGVERDGLMLFHASQRLKKLKWLVLVALRQNKDAYLHVDETLKNDPDVLRFST